MQHARRAARGRGRTGLAVLLVERTAYSINMTPSNRPVNADILAAEKPAERLHQPTKKARRRRAKAAVGAGKAPKDYAKHHGVHRGNNKRQDAVPDLDEQPRLNAESADEGLVAEHGVQTPAVEGCVQG